MPSTGFHSIRNTMSARRQYMIAATLGVRFFRKDCRTSFSDDPCLMTRAYTCDSSALEALRPKSNESRRRFSSSC